MGPAFKISPTLQRDCIAPTSHPHQLSRILKSSTTTYLYSTDATEKQCLTYSGHQYDESRASESIHVGQLRPPFNWWPDRPQAPTMLSVAQLAKTTVDNPETETRRLTDATFPLLPLILPMSTSAARCLGQ